MFVLAVGLMRLFSPLFVPILQVSPVFLSTLSVPLVL